MIPIDAQKLHRKTGTPAAGAADSVSPSGARDSQSVRSLARAKVGSKSHGTAAHNDRVDSIVIHLAALRDQSPDGRLVIGVTSPNRKAGVSVIAGKLAVRAAEMALGRVLLIDGNLDSPSQSRNFATSSHGLADILCRVVAIPDLLCNGVVDGLHVLPAGSGRTLKDVTVTPEIARSLIRELRGEFDLVIIDLPAVRSSARFLALANQTDGVLLIADAEQTRCRHAKRAIAKLESHGVHVLGTVLNRVARTLPRWLDRWF